MHSVFLTACSPATLVYILDGLYRLLSNLGVIEPASNSHMVLQVKRLSSTLHSGERSVGNALSNFTFCDLNLMVTVPSGCISTRTLI